MARSWQCQSQFKTRSGQVHGEVKERIRQGKSKVKTRSRGKFNNSNTINEYQINFYRPQLTLNSYNNKNHNNSINNNYNKTNSKKSGFDLIVISLVQSKFKLKTKILVSQSKRNH